jgi:peptidoglycan/xylan/chitin deacetylase (PgdA/CDA1 family)
MTDLTILMYHSMSPVAGKLSELGVPRSLFAEHLAALTDAGYLVCGLTEALARVGQPGGHRVVGLTVDDAYTDFLDVVPLLNSAYAGATVYVPSGVVGRPAFWLSEQAKGMHRVMDWSQLREVVAAGVEVGSHSRLHLQLDLLPAAALLAEVAGSRAEIETHLGTTVTSFCYPHGYHSRGVRQAVRDAGYDNACEVGRRTRSTSHRFALSRLFIGPGHTPERLLADVRGGGPVAVPLAKRGLQPAWRLARRFAPNQYRTDAV